MGYEKGLCKIVGKVLLDYASVAWKGSNKHFNRANPTKVSVSSLLCGKRWIVDPKKKAIYDDVLAKFDTSWDNDNNLLHHRPHTKTM